MLARAVAACRVRRRGRARSPRASCASAPPISPTTSTTTRPIAPAAPGGRRRSQRPGQPPRARLDDLARHPLQARRGDRRSLPRQLQQGERRPEATRRPSSTPSSSARSRKAIELAEKRAAAAPRDAQAQFDLGAAVGLQATYIASVEGRLMAGFRAARRSYDAAGDRPRARSEPQGGRARRRHLPLSSSRPSPCRCG